MSAATQAPNEAERQIKALKTSSEHTK